MHILRPCRVSSPVHLVVAYVTYMNWDMYPYIHMLDELEVIQGVGAGSNQRFTPDIYLGHALI